MFVLLKKLDIVYNIKNKTSTEILLIHSTFFSKQNAAPLSVPRRWLRSECPPWPFCHSTPVPRSVESPRRRSSPARSGPNMCYSPSTSHHPQQVRYRPVPRLPHPYPYLDPTARPLLSLALSCIYAQQAKATICYMAIYCTFHIRPPMIRFETIPFDAILSRSTHLSLQLKFPIWALGIEHWTLSFLLLRKTMALKSQKRRERCYFKIKLDEKLLTLLVGILIKIWFLKSNECL